MSDDDQTDYARVQMKSGKTRCDIRKEKKMIHEPVD